MNFIKAIELNPNDAIAHFQYGMYFWNSPVQDIENFLKHLRIANQLDPLSFSISNWLFYALIYNYKVIEAEELLNKTSHLIRSKESKIHRLSRLSVFKNKDWMEAIHLYEKELKKDPNNIAFNRHLRYLYNSVLIDREKALKHARKVYELDSSTINNKTELIWFLIHNNKLKEANELLKGDDIDDDDRNQYLWMQEYVSDNPSKIMDFHDKLKNPHDKILTFAKIGDVNSVNEMKTKYQIDSWTMAQVYANLKERDSMYFYINKISRNIDALNLNIN